MKHPVDVHVGKRVRHRRWMVGMTQQQLAEKVGIKFQQIQKYETGKSRLNTDMLMSIARALGVPRSYFFPVDANRSIRRQGRVVARVHRQQLRQGAGAQRLGQVRVALDPLGPFLGGGR